jgi:hypothetical protein
MLAVERRVYHIVVHPIMIKKRQRKGVVEVDGCADYYIGEFVVRHLVQRPDYRNDGKYQFVVSYTSWGNPECIHLTTEQIFERMEDKLGKGKLIDDGVNLWWEQDAE